jgi:hypothetical protein
MKIFSIIIVLSLTACTYGQKLNQVSFSYDGNLAYFTFITDQGVLLRISKDGELKEWGTEQASMRINNYYATQLQPYPGRVEYYGPETDSAYRGKVKSIGTCAITYYAHYELKIRVGKLRSLGRMMVDYYDNFAQASLQGNVKSFGDLAVDYYSSPTDNEAFRGKLKLIGSTRINYHSSFDDRDIRGKIKSIGPVNYSWYTSLDINRSGLKNDMYRTNINGVMYILR